MPKPNRRARASRPLLAMAPALALAGCATLPSSGPTAGEISRAHGELADFDLVDLTEDALSQIPMSSAQGGRFAAIALPGDVDRIGPGDVLEVSVYEVGAALFGSRAASMGFTPATGSSENLPPVTVGRDGWIALPWTGRTLAAGKTTDELADELTRAYRRSSENPQVMVRIRENVNNTVIVQGDVKKPGRIPLTLAGERLLDAIAIAGGPSNPSLDSIVRISRADQSAQAPLSAIEPGSSEDIRLLPQDRVSVAFRPRSFSVLGATGKVSEIPFQSPRVSLAEAIGRSGGPSDERADPAAIYIFRYVPAEYDGTPLPGARPVAYRLNLRRPQSYFLAQRFEMRPRDVIYVANARANVPTKAIQVLSLFFSPFYAVRTLTR